MKKLIITSGLPGSGQEDWIKTQFKDELITCQYKEWNDNLSKKERSKLKNKLLVNMLESDCDTIIYNGSNLILKDRIALFQIFRDVREVTLVQFFTPIECIDLVKNDLTIKDLRKALSIYDSGCENIDCHKYITVFNNVGDNINAYYNLNYVRHKHELQKNAYAIADEFMQRVNNHDSDKVLNDIIFNLYEEYAPKYHDAIYLSDEYFQFLSHVKPATDIHRGYQRHHFYNEESKIDRNIIDILDIVEVHLDIISTISMKNNLSDEEKKLAIAKSLQCIDEVDSNVSINKLFSNLKLKYFNK